MFHDSVSKGRICDICSELILKVKRNFIPFINKNDCRQYLSEVILVTWTKELETLYIRKSKSWDIYTTQQCVIYSVLNYE